MAEFKRIFRKVIRRPAVRKIAAVAKSAILSVHFGKRKIGHPIEPKAISPTEPIIVACQSMADFDILSPFLRLGGFSVVAVLLAESDEAAGKRAGSAGNAEVGSTVEFCGEFIETAAIDDMKLLAADVRYATTPVVIADIGDGEAFGSIGPRIASFLGPDQRLLHPAFLADFLPHELMGNTVVYGFPGSGNVVFQTIMRRMLTEKRKGRYDQLEAWCASGHIVLCEIINAAFGRLEATNVSIGYGQPGFLTVWASLVQPGPGSKEKLIYLPSVPSQVYMAEAVYGTHSRPCARSWRRVTSRGGRVAIVARHPLDVLVSMAGKYSTVASRDEAHKSGNSISDAKDRLTRELASQSDKLLSLSAYLAVFLKSAAPYARSAQVLHYEQLMEEPKAKISRIAEFLDVTLTDDFLDELCGLVGDVELGPAGHVFRPGTGKWTTFLPEERVSEVLATGLATYAKPLGYHEDGDVEGDENAPIRGPVLPLAHLYWLDDSRVASHVASDGVLTEVAEMVVSGDDAEVIERWSDLVDGDPWLRQSLRSMSFIDQHPWWARRGGASRPF